MNPSHLILRLAVALLTFVIGFASSALFNFVRPMPRPAYNEVHCRMHSSRIFVPPAPPCAPVAPIAPRPAFEWIGDPKTSNAESVEPPPPPPPPVRVR